MKLKKAHYRLHFNDIANLTYNYCKTTKLSSENFTGIKQLIFTIKTSCILDKKIHRYKMPFLTLSQLSNGQDMFHRRSRYSRGCDREGSCPHFIINSTIMTYSTPTETPCRIYYWTHRLLCSDMCRRCGWLF